MPLNTYRAWKRQNLQIGCVFARLMATNPAVHGQHGEIITGASPGTIASTIATRVEALVNDPSVTAAELVFPDLKDLSLVAQVALSLNGQANWAVSTSMLRGTPVGDVVAFNIVRSIPFNGGTCPSESLVLGPFDIFPATRRAPETGLELFVGVPPAVQPNGQPTTKAHLADVRINGIPKTTFDAMWNRTRAARLQSLGNHDDVRAKAKVSFVIPLALAAELGCAP